VLTTETVAQAEERADPKKFNRGGDAAKSAIEMVQVMRRLNRPAQELDTEHATRQFPAMRRHAD
jgi:6,7-dimethyl-8-ribityllumazine synthase